MSHEELVRLIESADVAGVSARIEARPELLDEPVPGCLLPDRLGKGQEGNTPLHVAALFGGREILALLLDAGANTQTRNAEGRTPIHVALEHNFESVQNFEALGLEMDLIHAACRQDLERMRAILTEDPDLACDCSTGLSVMGWATYYGARPSVEMLIEFGAGPDEFELRCAAGIASVELAELLIDHGADVDEISPEDGATALHVAAAHQYTSDAAEFVALLLEHGADRSICATERPITALELALEKLQAQEEAGIEEGDERWKNFSGVIELLEE